MNKLWHREAVGGLWEDMGRLQLDFLTSQGLKPEHKLLDIGCGSMRGGVHFVSYLEKGNYSGVDRDRALLDAGRIELESHGLLWKAPLLAEITDFGLVRLGARFDFLLAQSLFTHLDLNSVMRCLVNVTKVMNPLGRFYATFFLNPAGPSFLDPIPHPTRDSSRIVSHYDQDPYHYDLGVLDWIASRVGLNASYIGDWNHPRDQKMLMFTR
jgi:cyclopropane fatty-acyl-phospholipid synthase-like methyltransferase